MLLAAASEHDNSLVLLECGLTAIAIATAFAWPRLCNMWFIRIEQAFGQLAHMRGLAVASVGIITFLLRLAILPFSPIPLPLVPDDFSLMLACDTFAHGRLTNPTPAMWMHFETIHVDMLPTYMSMYFPSQGLLMAAGKVLFGDPWYAILICSALMCATICWMLQAWLPPGWALLGGILAMLRLGLFSYWINTYTGAGLLAGLGGALVLGSLPRLTKTGRFGYGMLMAVGVLRCCGCSPIRGTAAVPASRDCARPLGYLGEESSGSEGAASAGRCSFAADPGGRGVVGLLQPPRLWKRDHFALHCEPHHLCHGALLHLAVGNGRSRPIVIKECGGFTTESELKGFARVHSWTGFIPWTLVKVLTTFLFYAGIALLPPLLMVRRVMFNGRIRFLVICVVFLAAGMLIEIYLIPHYLAPFTAAFYAIGLQAMRHLKVWSPEGKPVGATLVRLSVLVCVALGAARVFARQLASEFRKSRRAVGRACGLARIASGRNGLGSRQGWKRFPASSLCWSAIRRSGTRWNNGSTTKPTSMHPKSYGHGRWINPIIWS